MTDTPVLEFRDICKSFSGVHVLKNISFSVEKGSIHALIGENGAGKSTLMKILSGAYTKDSGQILIDGKVVEVRNPLHARELGVSIIYQELSLIPQLNAAENVFLGCLPGSGIFVSWEEAHKKAQEVFHEVGLGIDTRTPVRRHSAAQCQMIEIARALLHNSKIVIMDEPTSSLTDKEVENLFRVVRQMQEKGVTVIFISHKLEELFRICDSVTVMKDGEVSGRARMDEIDKDALIRMMVGRKLSDYYPKREPKIGQTILQVKNLNCGDLVQDVSFELHRGEVLGFAGLVGAGRTETMRAIFAADIPQSGEILLKGKLVKFKHPKDAIKNGIAFTTEDRKTEGLVLCQSVAKNTTLASLDTICGKLPIISFRKEDRIVNEYIRKLNTKTTGKNQKVMNLSGGNQQKVVMAKWLNTNADIYIFDEPTRGIDVGAKSEIYHMIADLADQGAAVIVVSSELPEVLGISDRIIVMHEGKISGELMRSKATEEKVMAYAFGGVQQ